MTREELIKELENVKEKHKNDKHFTSELNISAMCNDVLKVLGRCEERKQGEWLTDSNLPDRLICSCCANHYDMWKWESKNMHFCPNCGADMRLKDNV